MTAGVNVTLYLLGGNNCSMTDWKTEVVVLLLLFQEQILLLKNS